MIETDIIIIGAGPVGLFTVFEAGLLKLRCHLIDALAQPGGQLTEIYPKKPIYDIPGYPSVLAGDLVDNLMQQAAPFSPGFTLGERAEAIEKKEDGTFLVRTNKGTEIAGSIVAIAGGLGSFEPRKPPVPRLEEFEDHGVDYIIKDPGKFRDKRVVIAGGGDSALDWTIYLADLAAELTLVHRRKGFRGALDSVEKVTSLAKEGRVRLITEAQIKELDGEGHLHAVTIEHDSEGTLRLETDYFIPLFGLTPKLGPIGDWGLQIENNAILVDPIDCSTNIEGIYAIGDINTYPNKLKLILCGFHEATMMVHAAFRHMHPEKKASLKYTTVTGIKGFS